MKNTTRHTSTTDNRLKIPTEPQFRYENSSWIQAKWFRTGFSNFHKANLSICWMNSQNIYLARHTTAIIARLHVEFSLAKKKVLFPNGKNPIILTTNEGGATVAFAIFFLNFSSKCQNVLSNFRIGFFFCSCSRVMPDAKAEKGGAFVHSYQQISTERK